MQTLTEDTGTERLGTHWRHSISDEETDGRIYADLAAPAQRQLSGELRD